MVSVRDRIEGDLGAMKIEEAIAKLHLEINERLVRQTFGNDNTGLGESGSDNEY